MDSVLLQGAGIGLGLLAVVITTLLQSAILKALLKNFRPDLQNNHWRNALIVCGVSSAASLLHPFLGTVAFFVLSMVLYRTSFFMTLGISILMSIVMAALVFGLVLGLATLWAIHPAVAVLVVVIAVVFFVLVQLRQKAQRERMQAVWNEPNQPGA